jgi:hypothetical protein
LPTTVAGIGSDPAALIGSNPPNADFVLPNTLPDILAMTGAQVNFWLNFYGQPIGGNDAVRKNRLRDYITMQWLVDLTKKRGMKRRR